MRRKRGAVLWDEMVYWILALLVLVVVIVLYFALSGKATGAAEFLKNLLKFGR